MGENRFSMKTKKLPSANAQISPNVNKAIGGAYPKVRWKLDEFGILPQNR